MLRGGSAPLALLMRTCYVHACYVRTRACFERTFSFAAPDAPPPACFWVSLFVPHASFVVLG